MMPQVLANSAPASLALLALQLLLGGASAHTAAGLAPLVASHLQQFCRQLLGSSWGAGLTKLAPCLGYFIGSGLGGGVGAAEEGDEGGDDRQQDTSLWGAARGADGGGWQYVSPGAGGQGRALLLAQLCCVAAFLVSVWLLPGGTCLRGVVCDL